MTKVEEFAQEIDISTEDARLALYQLACMGQPCRMCGCTDDHACTDKEGHTCSWTAPGLCSFCAEDAIRVSTITLLSAIHHAVRKRGIV